MATFVDILHVIYAVAKVILLSFLFFIMLYSIGHIASVIIGLLFWKKERDPRIKPFWRNIGKKGPLRGQE